MGAASLYHSVLVKHKVEVSILHSKGICLDAMDPNSMLVRFQLLFDLYLMVQTHLRMMSSCGISFDSDLAGRQSQARCESTS